MTSALLSGSVSGSVPTFVSPSSLRPWAVVKCLTRGPVQEDFVEIEKLLWLVLHDASRPPQATPELRLAGYQGRAIPWGARWGGAEQMRFEKNLLLRPRWNARGRRLDLRKQDVVQRVREMQQTLESGSRQPATTLPARLLLPRLWAGFAPGEANSLSGDGPEFWGSCHLSGLSSRELLAETVRRHRGLSLFPLDWVSHAWQSHPPIFAELADFPREQLVTCFSPEALRGYRGACEFDFLSSRFLWQHRD